MILTHHGIDSLRRTYDGYVNIGGHDYPYVKIGNLFWTAENLDYKFNDLVVGASGTSTIQPRGNYYLNDEATYGINGLYKCGLLYNWKAANYLQLNSFLPNGWRVPSKYDFEILASSIGGTAEGAKKLKAKDNFIFNGFPSGWNGINKYNFNAIPSGRYDDNGFALLGSYCLLWAYDQYSSTHGNSVNISSSDNLIIGNNGKMSERAIRLCKDVV